jgi:hypothetical protein
VRLKPLDGKLSRRAALKASRLPVLTTTFCIPVMMATAAASPPITLTCPDAGGAQIFLLDMDAARVVSATGIWRRDSNRRELMFKNVPIHATETALTWQWVQENGILNYALDRNTLELKAKFRPKSGEEGTYFEFKCALSRRQL